MARACPACGRPNADRATRCLYCSETFQALPADVTPPAVPETVVTGSSERHVIIVAPQPDATDIDSKAERFAEVVGLPSYDARLVLATKRHRLLRKVANARRAQELSEKLRDLTVAHFDIAESEIEALPVEEARRMTIMEDRVELGLAAGLRRRLEVSSLLLLVRGEIKRERYQERRMATPRGASRTLTPELRLHVYATDSRVAYELDPEQFDWSVLGKEQSPSTPLNFHRLTDVVLRLGPHVELDRGFDWEPVVLSRSGAGSELDAVLGNEKTGEGVIYDNQQQFRYYSRWRYLVAMAEKALTPDETHDVR
jgi:hypothetical protein